MFHGTFRLGRVAGIPLSANWSVVIVTALLTSSLATAVLPASVEGIAPLTAWLLGVVGASAFLASLLAHELGHAIVARRAGVPVDEITLWLFGGVAKIGGEAHSAEDELRISAAGPAVSGALAVGFGAGAVVTAAAGLPTALVALAIWLAVVNGSLAVFNLLPGLPLDGGRILRAYLWRRDGDRRAATLTAATAGRVVGGGLIALGILQLFAGGMGLWTAAIGLVILQAAKAEQRRVLRPERRLPDLRVVFEPDPSSSPFATHPIDTTARERPARESTAREAS